VSRADPLGHDVSVTIAIRRSGEEPMVFQMTISGQAIRREAALAPAPLDGPLAAATYRSRMVRRAVARLVEMVTQAAVRHAAWHAVSRWLDLDPSKGA